MIFEKFKCREKAARFIDAWILKAERTGDKFLAKFIGGLKNWRDKILNYSSNELATGLSKAQCAESNITHRVRL
jgi:transposase